MTHFAYEHSFMQLHIAIITSITGIADIPAPSHPSVYIAPSHPAHVCSLMPRPQFSSNARRTRGGARQPIVHAQSSRETPVSGTMRPSSMRHAHSRSLPTAASAHDVSSGAGLSTSDALRALVGELDRLVAADTSRKWPSLRQLFSDASLAAILRHVSLLVLLLAAIRGRRVDAFVYVVVLASLELFLVEGVWRRQRKFALCNALRDIRNELRALDKASLSGAMRPEQLYHTDVKVPLSTAVSYVRVVRDGRIWRVSPMLLVPGDTLVLAPGEKSPCASAPLQGRLQQLQQQRLLVQVREFPMTRVICEQLSFHHKSEHQLLLVSMLQEQTRRWIGHGLFVAAVSALARGRFNPTILVPFSLLSSPLVRIGWWLGSNCYLSLVLHQLLQSQTPFRETHEAGDVDVDEFDEDAPPPVKNIRIAPWTMIVEVTRLLLGRGSLKQHGLLRLWAGDAVEALGLTSVLCFVDREGPIASVHPFPRPCELIIPTTSKAELVAVELTSDLLMPHRVRPNFHALSGFHPRDLRALGLSLLASGEFHFETSGLAHCQRHDPLHSLRLLPEHLQVCHCQLAREIGFDPAISGRFRRLGAFWHNDGQSGAQDHASRRHHGHGRHHHHRRQHECTVVSVLVEDRWPVADTSIAPIASTASTTPTTLQFASPINSPTPTDPHTTPVAHLFTFGEVSEIVAGCAYVYAATGGAATSTVTGLSDSLVRKLCDFEETMRKCDVNCVAFSYRPVFADELQYASTGLDASMSMSANVNSASASSALAPIAIASAPGHAPTHLLSSATLRTHVFLGVVSACLEPKEHFQEFIDDLEAAGIRFAYFSPLPEQPSKAFGDRLGLETDWNSCILLSEHPNPASRSPGYQALSDIKARLPRGVHNIRPHLANVDDIPLHVSIFAECNGESAAEMIRIYQEAGEVVTVVGSCRSERNSGCFGVGHFAIGIDVNQQLAGGTGDGGVSFAGGRVHGAQEAAACHELPTLDDLALRLGAGSVRFILPLDASPYVLTEIVREARTLLHNSASAWAFFTGVVGSGILSLLAAPRDLAGTMSLLSVLSLVVATFAVAGSLIMGPYDPAVMKTHPTILEASKCPVEAPRQVLLPAISIEAWRFLPNCIILSCASWLFSSTNFRLFALIIAILQSAAYMHSVEPLSRRMVTANVHWCVVGGVVSVGSMLVTVLTEKIVSLVSLIVTVCAAMVFGGLCIGWHEAVKFAYLRDNFDQAQKRAKLLFNTKLGMHSPV